jgi:2-C-methyl-D-erythritol 2,4-cyclodiphosphate synthase
MTAISRIGFGYDVHRLENGRKFVIGGIRIPAEKGPVAHSDGDVLIHAICDALLGAACLGDIGMHFPDNSAEYKDIDSKILLKKVMELLKNRKYRVVNIDATVSLEKPKLKDFIPFMQQTLSEILEITPNDISVKATTSEELGFVGRQEGIAAQAVAMIIAE